MDLAGEAIFHVVHDAAPPFVVHAANATTEDPGTVFGVRASPGTGAVSVLVVSGKVALRPRARAGASAPAEGGVGAAVAAGAVLGRGQLGRLDASGHVDVTSGADTAAFLAWLSDRVVFRNATLADVAADVGRRFDVDVRIPDPAVASRRVTVDVAAHSLTDVLDAVTVPLGLHHRRARGTIVLGR
jgi:transmembrane sensor